MKNPIFSLATGLTVLTLAMMLGIQWLDIPQRQGSQPTQHSRPPAVDWEDGTRRLYRPWTREHELAQIRAIEFPNRTTGHADNRSLRTWKRRREA